MTLRYRAFYLLQNILHACLQAGAALQRVVRDSESEVEHLNVAQQSRVRKRRR